MAACDPERKTKSPYPKRAPVKTVEVKEVRDRGYALFYQSDNTGRLVPYVVLDNGFRYFSLIDVLRLAGLSTKGTSNYVKYITSDTDVIKAQPSSGKKPQLFVTMSGLGMIDLKHPGSLELHQQLEYAKKRLWQWSGKNPLKKIE